MQNGFMNGVDHMGGMWFFGAFAMLFWIAVFVALIVLVFRWPGSSSRDRDRPETTEILEARFARGEIGKAEFEDLKRQLRTWRGDKDLAQ